MERGREEGILENMFDAIKRGLELKFKQVNKKLLKTIQDIKDIEQLKQIQDALFVVNDINEFQEFLKKQKIITT